MKVHDEHKYLPGALHVSFQNLEANCAKARYCDANNNSEKVTNIMDKTKMGTYGSQSTFAMLDVGLRRCARATVAAAEPMSGIWLPGPCMPMGPAPPSDIRARLRAAQPSVCKQAEGARWQEDD